MFSGNIGVYGVMGNLWREQGIVTINGGDEKRDNAMNATLSKPCLV